MSSLYQWCTWQSSQIFNYQSPAGTIQFSPTPPGYFKSLRINQITVNFLSYPRPGWFPSRLAYNPSSWFPKQSKHSPHKVISQQNGDSSSCSSIGSLPGSNFPVEVFRVFLISQEYHSPQKLSKLLLDPHKSPRIFNPRPWSQDFSFSTIKDL